MEDKINNLNNTIRQLKQENTNIMKKYEEANNKIKQLTLENNNLKNKINQLQLQLNSQNNINNNINNDPNEMVRLYKKIEELTDKINRYPFVLEKNEKMLSIVFISISQNVNYSMICKNTDSIHKLEDKINILNNTITQLKQENKNIMKKYEEANNKIKELTLENNNLKNKINQLENIINDKNKEIQDNIFKINNLSGNNNNQIIFNPGDKILAVLFMSQGNQDIVNYTIPCKSTDLFVRLEERLYNDYPKYRNYETFFMVNTRRILRFKTLEENKIKSGDIISLFTNE